MEACTRVSASRRGELRLVLRRGTKGKVLSASVRKAGVGGSGGEPCRAAIRASRVCFVFVRCMRNLRRHAPRGEEERTLLTSAVAGRWRFSPRAKEQRDVVAEAKKRCQPANRSALQVRSLTTSSMPPTHARCPLAPEFAGLQPGLQRARACASEVKETDFIRDFHAFRLTIRAPAAIRFGIPTMRPMQKHAETAR